MEEVKQYIESGILELYVLGLTSADEMLQVEAVANEHVEVRAAIDEFSLSLEQHALANAIEPDVTVKAFVMATINYTLRLQNGEVPTFPPMLNEHSSINDYSPWLNRADMVLPETSPDVVFARIIGHTKKVTTAIVWLKDYAPSEVHHDEYERFLVVEGSCEIFIGNDSHSLTPGSYLQIPLHTGHKVTITSSVPCKVILQRVAA